MPILHAFFLGFLQGLTEFLPISSSGHLNLVPEIFGWEKLDPSIETTFDVALHAGTLIGAIAYLRNDVAKILSGLLKWIRERQLNQYARLGLLLGVTTIPGAILGALFEDFISTNLGDPWLIATVLIIFAMALFFADRSKGNRDDQSFSVKDAIVAGASQALALQPGVSRSGVTMTALRLQGFSREVSARLSFLMLIPIVAGATLFTGVKTALGDGIPSTLVLPMIVGVLTSAATGFFAVFILLKIVRKYSFTSFVIYRIVAGLGVFIWLIAK